MSDLIKIGPTPLKLASPTNNDLFFPYVLRPQVVRIVKRRLRYWYVLKLSPQNVSAYTGMRALTLNSATYSVMEPTVYPCLADRNARLLR